MSEPAARRRRAAWRVEWYRYGDSNPGPVAEKRSRRCPHTWARRLKPNRSAVPLTLTRKKKSAFGELGCNVTDGGLQV
jgi:hypothetical protein